jgi:hypothetical protein
MTLDEIFGGYSDAQLRHFLWLKQQTAAARDATPIPAQAGITPARSGNPEE